MTLNDPQLQREAEKYENPVASREYLLSIFQRLQTPITFKALCKELNYDQEQQQIAIKRRLRAMEVDGQIVFNKFKQYALPAEGVILTGKVIGHRDGYGFFAPEGGGKDLFISSFEMQRVIHGDVVEAMLADRDDKKGRQEVRILDVVEPRHAPLVGRFYVDNKVSLVIPDDARIKQEIMIAPENKSGARHGEIVVVEIIQRPSKRANAQGRIVEVLGKHMAPGMEIEIALREHDLPHQWPQAALDELAQWPDEVEESAKQGRTDLRKMPLVTIDGEDARDFDDAVYCEPQSGGGWRLWVAIADVSYYVRPETALDDEAINRGNSVYFPSQVIPMLPEKLSNGLCSLNPAVDRLCMVCEMKISADGQLTESTFYPAVMSSHARFTYTCVAQILEGDLALREQYQALVPHLESLHQLYFALVGARQSRGAIEFETQESKFIFNAERKIEAIEPLIRNDAHKIIEECMILANVATATFVEQHKMPGLFRVHDKPDNEKYQKFISYLGELGIELPYKEVPDPADYGYILAKVAGRPDQELIQTMLLRSMKQAVYQSDNIGHFGLALPSYSHFTSPIRRYPDLVIHRVIKSMLEGQENKAINVGCYSYPENAMVELGEHCSMTERRADEATRDVADWLKCEFMQDHVGMIFTGVISTVTNFGFFVRLSDLHIEGLVHISSLGQDYYQYDEKRMALVGEHSGKRFHVGDLLEVKVAAVNLDQKKIDLILTGDNAVLSRAKPLKKSRGKKSQDRQHGAEDKPKKSSTGSTNSAKASRSKAEKSSANPDNKDQGAKKKPVKSKVKKRVERKKRPGKNARKQDA